MSPNTTGMASTTTGLSSSATINKIWFAYDDNNEVIAAGENILDVANLSKARGCPDPLFVKRIDRRKNAR